VKLVSNIYRRLDLDGKPIIGPPYPKQLEVLRELFREPYNGELRKLHLSCGWGFGKTYLGIDIAQALLDLGPNSNGWFIEPTAQMMYGHFLGTWQRTVPPELYTHNKERRTITWLRTGSTLRYEHRNTTGSLQHTLDKFQGHNIAWYIDDEAATGCHPEVHRCLRGRVRQPQAPLYAIVTLSTPRMGPYADLINESGSVVIRGRTEDNPFLSPQIVADMRASMSRAQAARDMDGELIALEDQIWDMVDLEHPWPVGNVDYNHPRFNSNLPWYLGIDIGSSTGAYVVVQPVPDGIRRGEPRWVIVADYCPQANADVRRAFRRLREEFGVPAGVVAGADINTRASTDGATVSYFVRKIFGNVRIMIADEHVTPRHTAYDLTNYLFRSADGTRRLTVASSLVDGDRPGVLDKDSKRGIVEMVQQDIWPPIEEVRQGQYLPKGQKIRVSHIRDALLNVASEAIRPPTWAGDPDDKPWH